MSSLYTINSLFENGIFCDNFCMQRVLSDELVLSILLYIVNRYAPLVQREIK